MTARIKEILAAMEANGGAYCTTKEMAQVKRAMAKRGGLK